MKIYSYLIPEISKISFVTLKRDIKGKGNIQLNKNISLPLIMDADVNIRNIIEGILYYFALVKDIDDREYYIDIIKNIDKEIGGVKLIPVGYSKNDTKKAMILALGLINANYYDVNSFIVAGEMANVLNKELDDENYINIATDIFRTGLELYDNWIFYYHLGYLYYNQEEYIKSVEYFEFALSKSPNEDYIEELHSLISMSNAKTDYNKAYNLYEKGQYIDASILFEGLTKEYGEWYNLFLLLAEVYIQMGENDKAIISLERCLALKKPSKELFLKLGFLYLNDAMFQKAHDLYDRANEMYPDNSDILTDYSIASYYTKNTDKAINLINKSIEINPDDDISHKWKEFYLKTKLLREI